MNKICCACLPMLLALTLAAQKNNINEWVNPFIGTGGHGHTYPGAVAPFGMVQLSPDTRTEGWDGCSGYHRSDTTILGFSHTHLSGTGVPDYADLLVTPLVQAEQPFGGPMRFDQETARPGFYGVRLDETVSVQLTATPRVGLHRYVFAVEKAEGESVGLRLDLNHRDVLLEHRLSKVSEREVEGFRVSQGWATKQHFYFVVRFSEPIQHFFYQKNKPGDEQRGTSVAHAFFQLPPNKTIEVRVGVSGVSMEQARKNLDAEAPWAHTFDETLAMNEAAWSKQLSQITINGGRAGDLKKFYTALYHCFVVPNIWSDVDGQYRGMDGKVHKAEGYDHYTVFSLWDTYRAWHPLMTILDQKRSSDFVQTFLQQYEQQGRLPVWELAGNETDCMIGYHSASVIADAYTKGIRGYDADKALAAMRATAARDARGLADFRTLGFLRGEKERESVSQTLEYAYDDWCIAQMAQAMGKTEVCAEFAVRARGWINLLDRRTGLFRPRMNGGFIQGFDPKEVNFHFTEANAWQYAFSAPQEFHVWSRFVNAPRLLDSLFRQKNQTTGREQADITGLIGQYAHGNEPSHHIAYLYNLVGQPWKTQDLVRKILDSLYTDQPDGLAGNEDCGQMSAWYALSAMGLYPLVPGSPYYALTAPQFDDLSIKLQNGKTFRILAPCGKHSCGYIQRVTLNGKPLDRMYISHEEIMAGGTLSFEFGEKPVVFGKEAWPAPVGPCGTARQEAAEKSLLVPAPSIEGEKTFRGLTEVSIEHLYPDAEIRFTTDGTVPTGASPRYLRPFIINKSTVVKAIALYREPGGRTDQVTFGVPVEAEFRQVEEAMAITYEKGRYANQYDGGGNLCLIDGIRGAIDFGAGAWQGFEGEDVVLVLDLGEAKAIHTVGLGCIEDQNAWIFFPQRVLFEYSLDGNTYKPLGKAIDHVPAKTDTPIILDFGGPRKTKARFLRATVTAQKNCPAWHKGAGGKAWLFVDEFIAR